MTFKVMWKLWPRVAEETMQLRCGPQLWRSSTFPHRRSRCWEGPWGLWPPSYVQRKAALDAVSGVVDTGFRGWADGPVKPSCLERGLTLKRLGWNGQPVTPSSTSCSWLCTTVASGGKISFPQNGKKCCQGPPDTQAVLLWAKCMKHGVPGSWGRVCGSIRSRCHLLLGQRPWPGIGAGHIELCCRGWTQTHTFCCRGHAFNVERLPATYVVTAWKRYVAHAWMKLGWLVVRFLDRSLAAWRWLQEKELGAPLHRFGRARPVSKLPEPFCSSSLPGEPWWIVSGAAWVLWMTGRQPIRCAEDDVPMSFASSSSVGRRDRPTVAIDEEGWSPVTAMDLLNANRVATWRDNAGMQEDSDFGYRWSSYEQAAADAGHTVARAWLTVRAEQEELLWPAADLMVESLPKPVPSKSPRLQEPIKRKAHWGLKRKGARLRRNTEESPDAINNRAQALTKVFARLGAIRPRKAMSAGLYEEWQESVQRLAQHLVTQAESPTILNAIKTGEELPVFTKARSRLPQDVDRVDLDSFLNGRHGTNAPTRALASLKWLNNQGQFGWPVQDLHIPAPANPRKKKGQALVITPPMLTFLEEQAEAMWVAGDEHWTCLLGNWMVAAGCMRYKHLLRSEPRRISLSTFHAFCGRGKQRDNRKGFYWALPGHFASGFPWAKHWLTMFSALSETQRQNCGLCFDNNGEPWAMSEITAQAQIQFKDHVPDATALTTYSFRRWGPTLGQLLKLSPVELNALGDWQNKGEAPKAAAMPLHYSAAKYTESVRVKHLVLGSLHFVCDFEAWEVIPDSELLEAAKLGRQAVDQAISRDSQTVWTVPLSADDVKDQLRVSGELVEKAQALKSKTSSIQGKVLSAYMKNGVALCGSYQVKKCELPESQCSGAHKCSVLLKQVRVCGGRRPACECQDRRAMLVEKMPVPEAQSPRPAR